MEPKKIFSNIIVRLPMIVLVLLAAITILIGYYFYKGDIGAKSTALFGGFVSGLVLVIVQFLFSWAEYVATSRINALGVKKVLLHRDDRVFYQNLIANTNKRVEVMGVTAERFIDHFADSQGDRPENESALGALSRGVSVRILVPDQQYLSSEGEKVNANNVASRFKQIASQFNNFQYRYFKHEPTHSITVIDNNCILGPVFPGVPSKHTPALFMTTDSKYAQKYLDYFEREWEKAATIHQA